MRQIQVEKDKTNQLIYQILLQTGKKKPTLKQTSYNKKRLHNIQFQCSFIEYLRDNQISLHLNEQCSY